MIKIEINSMVYIPNSVGSNVIRRIKSSLTFDNPNKKTQSNKYGTYETSVYLFNQVNGHLVCPRGSINLILSVLKEESVNYTISSSVSFNKKKAQLDERLSSMLRDYQKVCVANMLSSVQGIVNIPCGGGKTFIGSVACEASKQNTIILVHTEDLQKQWQETFRKISSNMKIRIVGGIGGQDFKPLVNEVAICTVQTLDSKIDLIHEFISSAGTIILDEAHHAPAAMFQKILKLSTARYRWGLTATPDRPDGLGFVLPIVFGKTVFSMKASELFEKGYLMLPKIVPVETGISFYCPKDFSITDAVTQVTFSERRMQAIVRLCFYSKKYGRSILVLLPRVKACEELKEKLKEISIHSESLTSSTKNRQAILALFRKGKLKVIIATQLADEGLDLPNVDTLIMASAGKGTGRAVQRVGRVMRVCDKKNNPIVFDLVDEGIFKKHFLNRSIAYYSEIGVHTEELQSVSDAIKNNLKALGSKKCQ